MGTRIFTTLFFFLMIRRPPKSTPFPSPPLFRPADEVEQEPPAVLPGLQPVQVADRVDPAEAERGLVADRRDVLDRRERPGDRKSTRLNSSHANISYAVFCLKKNKKLKTRHSLTT